MEKVFSPSDKKLDAVSVEDELREYKPDVIITYGYWQKFQKRVYRWAVKHPIKLVYISDSELRHKSNIVKEVVKLIFIKKNIFQKSIISFSWRCKMKIFISTMV